MREEKFLEIVERTARISREEAERAVRATLRTLAERITRGEAATSRRFFPRSFGAS